MSMCRPKFVWLLAMALVLWVLAGCTAAPAPAESPPPQAQLATAATCADSPELAIPAGLNSPQLEEVLYAAYLEVKAMLDQCVNGAEASLW